MEINKTHTYLQVTATVSNLQTLEAELEYKVLTIINIFLITQFGNLHVPLKFFMAWNITYITY